MPGSHRRDRRGRFRRRNRPPSPRRHDAPRPRLLRRGLGSVDYILRSALEKSEHITLIDRFTVHYRVAESPRLFYCMNLYRVLICILGVHQVQFSLLVLSLKFVSIGSTSFYLLLVSIFSCSLCFCALSIIQFEALKVSRNGYYFERFFIKLYQCVLHVSWWFSKFLNSLLLWIIVLALCNYLVILTNLSSNLLQRLFKGQCHEIFRFWVFFMNQFPGFPPSPRVYIPLGPFRFFSKICGNIRSSRLTTGINDTGGKFATGINNNGGKFFSFATGVNDTGGGQPWAGNISANFSL